MSINFMTNDKKQDWLKINCKSVKCDHLSVTNTIERPYAKHISVVPSAVTIAPLAYVFASTGTANFYTNSNETFKNNLDGNIKILKTGKYNISVYSKGTANLTDNIYSLAVIINEKCDIPASRHISTCASLIKGNELSFNLSDEINLNEGDLIAFGMKGTATVDKPSTYNCDHWDVTITKC